MIAFVIALVYNSAHRYSAHPLTLSLTLSLYPCHTHTHICHRTLALFVCARTSENASYENLCENASSFFTAKAHWTVQIASNLIFPFLFCARTRNQLAAPIAQHTAFTPPPSFHFFLPLNTLRPPLHFGPAGTQQLCVIPKSARSTFRVQTLY